MENENWLLTGLWASAYSGASMLSLYRHYYYYCPLSTGRDGQAIGCRRAMKI